MERRRSPKRNYTDFPSVTGSLYRIKILVFSVLIKHVKNRSYFCKAKNFMFQILILEFMQAHDFKCRPVF